MSTISASTTSTTAYKVTADTTGTLVLQTGASPTTAVTIDTSQNVGVGTSSPAAKLDVRGTTNFLAPNATNSGGSFRFGYGSGGYAGTMMINADNDTGGAYIAWNTGTKIGSATGTYVVNGYATKIDGQLGILKFLNTSSGTAGADITWYERMQINSSGQITTPYQPCLVAIVTSNKTVSTSASLQFDSISLNRNSAITVSVSNSRFTVPVTGYYVFAMSAFMSSNNDSALDVRVNGVTNSYRFGSNLTGVTGTASNLGTCVSVPLSLSAGDYIEVFGPGSAKTVLGTSPTHSQMSLTLIG